MLLYSRSLKAVTGSEGGHSVLWSFGLGAGRICCVQVSGGLLRCLHTGLSVDSLKDSSVTGIPQPGSWREEGVRMCVCVYVCHWVHCCRNVKPRRLIDDLHAVLKYRWSRRTSSGWKSANEDTKVMLVCLST